jgi:hypothetical protein
MKTKTKLITFTLAATIAAGLFAIPLYVLVIQESEKIADSIRMFNKECAGLGDTATEQQGRECYEKHGTIVQALAKFVILANQELDFLPENPHSEDSEPKNNPSFDAWKKLHPDYNPADEDKRTLARRKDMQLQVRWAQHWINCLGRENASECKEERAALDKETYPFGRVGLMILEHPTHEGEEEAKHWHAVKVIPPGIAAPNEEVQTFIQAFVRDMASNDATLQMRYYNNPCRYYDQGNTPLAAIRKDIERDIRAWKKRAYSLHTQPVIRNTGASEYTASFEMAYTLEDPKPKRSGILAMSLSLKQDNGTFLITGIQKRVISAHKG